MDIIKLLSSDDLHKLYYELDIEDEEIEKAEKGAGTSDVFLKAMSVFNSWKKRYPSKATRKTLLTALKECDLIDPLEKLENKWGTMS